MKNAIHVMAIVSQLVLVIVLALFTSGAIYAQSLATTYFVDAQKGNDANNGLSLEKPFKTISKAKDAVRFLDKSGSSNITVNLRGGTYFQDQTLEFTEKDGGTENCKIIYRNYKDEVPVISGGKRITGWKIFDKAKNIYRAPSNSLEFRQLYVNGDRAIRSRQPNLGESYYQIVKWYKDTVNKRMDIKINKAEIAGWKNLSKVEMITLNAFTSNHLRLSSFTSDDKFAYVKMQDAESKILFKVADAFWKLPYFFENAYEFIDSEGEWYLNASDGFVYYKPSKNENMNNVEARAPYLETVMKVEGSSLDKPVKNLQFQGIEFSFSTWLWPDKNGCVEYQAFHPFSLEQKPFSTNTRFIVKHPELGDKYKANGAENNFTAPAGVYVAKADYITFERCSFKHMGANGINLHYGTHFCKLNGNVVFDISGHGISEMMQNYDHLGSMEFYLPKDFREVCSNDIITNNYIAFCGMDYKGAIGIFCGYTKNVTIAHNEITQMPYAGISMGWGWAYANDTTVMKNNKINFNFVHEVNCETLLHDGGAIYTLSDQPGSEIKKNYCVSHRKGLHTDEGTAHFTITNNVVDVGDGLEWICFYDREKHHDDHADHNFTNSSIEFLNCADCTITNTTRVPDRNWPAEAKEIIKNAGLEATYKDIKDELKPQNQKINLNTKRVD